jgi:hypothetical protein
MKNQGLRIGVLQVILATASALAMPAQAQDTGPTTRCAYQPSIGDLAGLYNATVGPGALTSDGTTIPMATIQTYQTMLAVMDGGLTMMTEGSPSIALAPVGGDEPDWVGPGSVAGTPVFSTADLGLTLGCDENTLVRLIGTGIATSQEGKQFEFTIRLVAAVNGVLVGGMSWTVDGMTMRQRLVFSQGEI